MTFRERNTVAEVYFINAIEIPWTNNDGNWIYDVNRMETWNVMKFISMFVKICIGLHRTTNSYQWYNEYSIK